MTVTQAFIPDEAIKVEHLTVYISSFRLGSSNWGLPLTSVEILIVPPKRPREWTAGRALEPN